MTFKRGCDGKWHLSEAEALEVRDDYARTKDFWIYDMDANMELLQAALNFLHNSVEGNNYIVQYMDSQNSCRLVINCKPCNKQLSSYDPFMSHDQGKNHKKCIQQHINKLEAERIAQKEIAFKPLNSPKDIFNPSSLEDMIDHCSQRVLGLQFLYKERLHGYDSSFRYTCQLCGIKRVKQSDMFEHLTEKALHNQKYILAKFNRRISISDVYANKCKEIESLEGKVNHNIVDFTQQVEMLRKLRGNATPPSSPPPSPTRRSRSPPKRSLTPPAPLVTHAEVQVNTDELDVDLPLVKEMAMLKLNDGDQHLSKDFEAIELMLETLQSLNLKMNSYYKRTSRNRMKYTSKYQGYVNETHKIIKQCLSATVKQ